jgi:hypothetical protein
MNRELEKAFSYHAPKAGNLPKFLAVREKAKELAYVLEENCPASHDRTQAIDKLREVVMWANASIATDDK